ncbi:MAG: hypothetical protein HOI67_08740 [Gammaproteobacteria bacterium]|nr:hypothetical protein [Gammaproteobacteria bacterium]
MNLKVHLHMIILGGV